MWYSGKQQGQNIRLQDSRAERNFKYKNIHDLKSVPYIKLFSNLPITIDKAIDPSGVVALPNKDFNGYLSHEY